MNTLVDHRKVSLSLAGFSARPAAVSRPFPPAGPEPSPLASLTAGERRALAIVYGAFLAGDDPYLEADELTHLARSLDLNEDRFRRDLAGLGFAGLLGLTRSRQDFEIEQVECNPDGLETFCRGFLPDRYETLLCEVAQRITRGVADGPTLRRALPWEPGLMLTHAVEALAADGWLTVAGPFDGSFGWQVTTVSPELRAWAAAERAAAPNVWTRGLVALDSAEAAAA